MPDGLQIGKSNENTAVFIDFQRIQVGPGLGPGIEGIWSGEGNAHTLGGQETPNLNDTNQSRLLNPS